MLVALVLFALIGGAGLAVLDQARTDGRLERLADVQRAMHLLTLDFMQATGGSLGLERRRCSVPAQRRIGVEWRCATASTAPS